jgi:alpha-L-fucosidase
VIFCCASSAEMGDTMKKIISFVMSMVLIFGMMFAQAVPAQAYQVSSNMKWWAADRFGMFIHFGSYSCYGKGEWAMSEKKMSKQEYQTKVSSKFNPTDFDANAIVTAAKNAGMKYLVFTAKHHEGLSMWDTKVGSFKDYTGTKTYSLQQYTPFGSTGRDIIMELKNACSAAGIHFGLYYSIMDWNHSSQEIGAGFTKMSSMTARTNYINDMKAQLKELVDNYDPDIMWFDGDWTHNAKTPTLNSWWTKSDGKDLYQYMKSLKSSIIVNERVCRGYHLGDFECPEQTIPSSALSRSWETCQTMNGAWGYKKDLENEYASTKEIVRELVTTVSREGNFLLNIGPKGNGTMTAGSIKILKGVGNWMKTYSDSIYGTLRNPFHKDPKWGTYTRKNATIYAHVYHWPKKGKKLVVSRYTKAGKLLKITQNTTAGKSLKYQISGKKIKITIPKNVPNKIDSVIVMQYQSKS